MSRVISRRFQYVVMLAAIVLVASACGGGDDDTADPSDGNNTTTTSASSDSTTTTAPEVSGDGDSTWCRRVRDIIESDEPSPLSFNFFGMSSEQLQQQFERNLEVFEEWADIAPPEIDAEVDSFVDGFRTVVRIGNENSWNINLLANDPEFEAAFGSDVEAAGNAIDAYNRDVCGVELGFDPATGAPSTTLPADDDYVGQLLALLGVPAGFLPPAALECMNGELADYFTEPIGPGYVPTDEDFEAFDDAAEVCNVAGLGG